jgi:hypothetical protein
MVGFHGIAMAGLAPVIPLKKDATVPHDRDRRVKPGDDGEWSIRIGRGSNGVETIELDILMDLVPATKWVGKLPIDRSGQRRAL